MVHERSGTSYTHVTLRGIAASHLRQAETDASGSFQASLVASLFAYLTIEAFVNYLGEVAFGLEKWQRNFSRGLSTKAKVVLIADKINIEVDWGAEHFSMFSNLRKLRHGVVHGNAEYLESTEPFDPKDMELLRPELNQVCTPSNARVF